MKKSPGRPSKYTPALAAAICARLAAGESLRAICRGKGMPSEATIRVWARDDVEGFYAQYARARDIGLDVLADETLAIADTPMEGVRIEKSKDGIKEVREDMLGHRRLQVDTRKWYLSKLAPKRYGDKTSMELTGADGGPVQISDTERAAKLAALVAAAQKRAESSQSEQDSAEAS